METTTVQMIAEVRAKPAHVEDVAEMCKTFAEQVRQRPGCERVEVYRHADEPATFVAFLSFVDEQSFVEHLEDAWRQLLVQQASAWLVERPRRRMMERLA